MSVEEDIKTRQSQTANAASSAESKKVLDAIRKRNADLAKRQQEAKKKLASLKSLYDTYISELAAGEFAIGENQGKKFTPAEREKRKALAEDTAKQISNLNKLISQKPEPVRLPTAPKPQDAKPTTGPTGNVTPTTTTTANAALDKPVEDGPMEEKNGILYVNGKPATGTVEYTNQIVTYKDGKKVSSKPISTKKSNAKTSSSATMPTMPTGDKTGTAGAGFNPAVVRAGEEGGTANIPAKSERDLATILQKTEFSDLS